MGSVHAYEYGGLDRLQLTDTLRPPVLRRADDLLVRVHCSTVQPIDIALLSGYGSALLPYVAKLTSANSTAPPLPLILGRDFCGEVVAAGPAVPANLRPGQLVWGARAPFESGCHAQFALASAPCVRPLPDGVDPAAAACVAYPGLTALSAMRAAGLPRPDAGADPIRRPDPAVLVLGASGGVGTLLVQLLRSLVPACRLTVTCPARHVAALRQLGHVDPAAIVPAGGVDTDAAIERLSALAPFDVALDLTKDAATRRRILPLLRSRGERHVSHPTVLVTLNSPALSAFDAYGLARGAVRAASAYLADARAGVGWAFFRHSGSGLDTLAGMLARDQLAPLVDRRFPMAQFREAFELAATGGGRGLGRVVLDLDLPAVPRNPLI